MRHPFPPISKRPPGSTDLAQQALGSRCDASLVIKGDAGSGALFDGSGKFRYLLWRTWDDRRPHLCFLLLNPSTADHERSDPTITRCLNFARRFQFGGANIVNIFALRSTDSSQLYKVKDPIGARNDEFIDLAVRASDFVIFAWGNHGLFKNRQADVLQVLDSKPPAYCFGLTKLGQPRHPLYLRSDAPLIRF